MGSVPRYLTGVQLDIDGTFGLDGFESLLSDDPAPDECPEMPIWFDFEPSEEDERWAAQQAALDDFDRQPNWDRMAALDAAMDRLERGLDASHDHAGSFIGHEG